MDSCTSAVGLHGSPERDMATLVDRHSSVSAIRCTSARVPLRAIRSFNVELNVQPELIQNDLGTFVTRHNAMEDDAVGVDIQEAPVSIRRVIAVVGATGSGECQVRGVVELRMATDREMQGRPPSANALPPNGSTTSTALPVFPPPFRRCASWGARTSLWNFSTRPEHLECPLHLLQRRPKRQWASA
jgi:hypothetical protein